MIHIQHIAILMFIFLLHVFFARKIYQIIRALKTEEKLLFPKLDELKESNPHQVMSQLNHWINENHQKLTPEFLQSWKNFFNHYSQNNKNVIPDVYDYFEEERLIYIRGQRQLFDLVPSLFLGIGIFGTFLGLVIATAGIQANGDSETLRQGVTSLINGMNTAFYCSIAGIVSSLLWQFFDRNWYQPQLIRGLHNLRNKLDALLPVSDEHSILQEMLITQKKQVEHLEVYLSKNIIPQIATEMSKSLESIFVPHLQNSHAIMNAIATKSNENQLKGIKEMVDQFIQSLNHMSGNHMKNLESSLRQTVAWQEKVHSEMAQLIDSLEKSAEKQSEMVQHTTRLTEEIYQFADQLSKYQSILDSTVAELKETTQQNKNLQVATTDLLEKMTNERKIFDEQLQHHSELLQKNVATINEHTALQNDLHQKYRQLTEQWNISLSQVRTLTDGHTELLGTTQKQNERLSQIHEQLYSLLDELKEMIKSNHNIFTDLLEVQQTVSNDRQHFSQIQNQIHEQLSQQIDQMSEHIFTLQEHWQKTHQLFDKVQAQLPETMQKLTQDIHHNLNQNIQQWSEELNQSVQTLTLIIHSLNQSVTQLPNQMDQLNSYVHEFNQKIEKSIEETNKSLSKAIHAFNQNTERLLQQSGV